MKVQKIIDTFGRSGLKFQKMSPEILLATGILGAIGTGYLIHRAAKKVDAVVVEHKSSLAYLERIKSSEAINVYTPRDYKKDVVLAHLNTVSEFAKLYGPALVLGSISVGCLVGSHGIMKNRNFALIAAYKTIEEGFHAYRNRVKEEYGEETDYMYKHGLRKEEVIETETSETGKTKKVKKMKLNADSDTNNLSDYARFFDENASQWTKTPEYNLMFLRAQQNYHNNLLRSRGHVFLNEVYDALGIPRTQAGAVVGWVIGLEGDNFIDFGIFDGERQKSRDFVNGYERSILLDFNVDGVIYDLI